MASSPRLPKRDTRNHDHLSTAPSQLIKVEHYPSHNIPEKQAIARAVKVTSKGLNMAERVTWKATMMAMGASQGNRFAILLQYKV